MANIVTVEELGDLLARREAVLVFDVRSRAEFDGGTLPGAVSVPADALVRNAPTIPSGVQVVCVCTRGGNRSQGAAALLRGAGFTASHLAGGLEAWARVHGGPAPVAHG